MAKKTEKSNLETLLGELEKKYGLGSEELKPNKIVSTGSIQLNQAMRVGGTIVGKMIEVYGENSSGKSTLMMHQLAEYQRAFPSKKVALFDYEFSFDLDYAKSIGVDIDNLLIYQPTTQEDGYDMLIALIENDIISCAVIDSQSAAMPKAILEGEMGDATIGLQARNNSKFCMKIKGLLSIHDCTLFIVSQLRDAIGSMGEPTTTTGGKAIRFYSDIRWKVWKMNDKANEANKTTVDVVKSKVGKPFGQAKFLIHWGKGISQINEIIDYAVEFDFIKKGGAWFTLGEEKLQGEENVKIYLEENPKVFNELREKVVNKLKNTEICENV